MYLSSMRELRNKKRLTAKTLGEMVGVSEAAISTYETGKREPPMGVLCAIADVLDCSLDLLIRGKEKDRHNGRSKEDILKEFDTMTEEELVRLSAFLQAALAEKRFQAHLRQDGQANP